MLENIISEWTSIDEYYSVSRDGNYIFEVPNIDNQLENDMLEFVDKALTQEKATEILLLYFEDNEYERQTLIQMCTIKILNLEALDKDMIVQ
ncbi:hypothetical protein RhiirA5_425510 [Rhizophagus irregularis]|uniref:Uncharacterized protein n=1 Tax=Rhizophagus irregularis TaxID=588596 RepID=A0A2I1EWH6_9GLOM|nr:hypothetical protein RhiirA5_425510 [Rhizophagus irregularis]PKC71568.1 hypothetical protein RhiirA1_453362 [Rhizophagus irregularis]PKY26468.1 hypothetical protein RhiirB3_528596 [Rhizophagus irregularis]